MSWIYEKHIEGGAFFMFPIAILLILNLSLIVYVVYQLLSRKNISQKSVELIRHIGGLALAWGTLGTLIGLVAAFDALEEAKGTIADYIIYGGLKVALLTVIYGFFAYILSILSYIIIKVLDKKASS